MRRFVRTFVRAIVRRSRLDAEIADELTFHIEARAADLVKRGASREVALRQARLEFGAFEAYKEAGRDAAGLRFLGDVSADFRYATRLMRRQPVFAAVAILSLALGIGANTLVFSVVNALVLRPLPVDRPEQLVFVQAPGRPSISFPQYRDIRDRNNTLSGVVGYRIAVMNLEQNQASARVWGYLVTGNYFDVLGVQPAAGTFFHQAQDQPPAPSPLAVLSYDCWVVRFLADPNIAGRTVRINGLPYTVLGVTPRGFIGTELFYRPEVYVPMTMQPQIEVRTSYLDDRGTGNTWALGRLKSGVLPAQAQANLDVIAAALRREYPSSDEGLRLMLSEPGLGGTTLRSPLTAFSVGVLLLAGLVLLMACVNLAVVLTARGGERQRELAIRLSIGAATGRLVRQLLTETLVLALAGGLAGLALAFLAARALSAWQLPVELPMQFDVTPDGSVFLFAVAISTLAGLLFGLAPARQAVRTNASAVLKGAGVGMKLVRRRLSLADVLVATQVAICVLLLAGSLLAIRGVQASMTMPLGFEPRGVAMVGFDAGLAGYGEARGRDLQTRALEAVRHLPGVDSAAYSDTLPLNIDQSNTTIYPEDQPGLTVAEAPSASRYRVSPGFFATLGMRLREGRDFDSRDAPGAARTAIVNQTFARLILRTTDPLGHRFRRGPGGDWIEVVGVVEDGKCQSLTESPQSAVFEAAVQQYTTNVLLTARSALPPGQLVASMRAAMAKIDPALALYEAQSLDEMLALQRLPNRVAAIALGSFGALALLLAVTGLHGIVTQAVARRRKEIGIRIAIGATPAQVLRLVLTRTLVLLAGGALVGGIAVVLAGGVLTSVVYGASLRDPMILAGVVLGLIAAGWVSCWVPARRALGVSVIAALRGD